MAAPAGVREAGPPTPAALPTLGVELEMAVIGAHGRSACVGEGYFAALQRLRGGPARARIERIGARAVALHAPGGVNGIDNGFNLLETAHAPQPAGAGGLRRLAGRIRSDLADVLAALAEEGLALTSLAQHPTAGIDPAFYAATVAPKPIYGALSRHRGWRHAVGIDAKAQNGPTTGLHHDTCVSALNLLLAAGPAFIALYANSPFEAGRATGLMETRMTLWPRMLATSRVAADRARIGLPPAWFTSLGDYFRWTFGPGTVMHAIPAGAGSYKGVGALHIAGGGRLGATEFFCGDGVPARRIGEGEAEEHAPCTIRPTAAHFEFLQWSNFLDSRLRFAFGGGSGDGPAPGELAEAFRQPALFDRLFAEHAHNLYLENRCAGAVFPDDDLAWQADAGVLASSVVSPCALQAGLVAAGPDAAARFLERWPLDELRALREVAIRYALSRPGDSRLHDLCAEVLELAARYLPAADHWTLAYPEWVLRTGRTGAARALAAGSEGPADLERLARARGVRLPPAPPLE